MKLNELTISQVSLMLEKGETSALALCKAVFAQIEKVEPKIDAFITILKEEALKNAKESDERRRSGKAKSRLDGVPIALKDLLCTKGVETTAASNILKDFVPCYDATVVKKLKKAGAIIIGKTNLDAFAHGSSTENSDFKTTHNPWDLERVPGGSSGGSAAAVAADMCLGAIGTDTGGSIRHPASLCGVVGLKPTYGRVSRFGVIAMASSLDVVGPITKTTEDAALILEAIAGKDELDGTTLDAPVPKYSESLEKDIKGLKVGVPEEYFAEGIDEDVKATVLDAVDKLENLGAKIVKMSLPSLDYALAAYYILMPAEVSSNLLRYDGIKYGYSTLSQKSEVKSQNLRDVYFRSRGDGFGAEAKRRIMLGTYVLSAGYFDAYYRRAMKLRTKVKEDFENAFAKVDVIITPVSPTPAFKIGEKSDNPVQMYLGDIFTVPINPAGIPAISTPVGFVLRDGKKLPVGAQIIGPMLGEEVILNVSHKLEKALNIKEKPRL